MVAQQAAVKLVVLDVADELGLVSLIEKGSTTMARVTARMWRGTNNAPAQATARQCPRLRWRPLQHKPETSSRWIATRIATAPDSVTYIVVRVRSQSVPDVP
jgi:hypothetical protein